MHSREASFMFIDSQPQSRVRSVSWTSTPYSLYNSNKHINTVFRPVEDDHMMNCAEKSIEPRKRTFDCLQPPFKTAASSLKANLAEAAATLLKEESLSFVTSQTAL